MSTIWSSMTSLWWENSRVQELLKVFGRVSLLINDGRWLLNNHQSLFKPLVEELGYETTPSDSPDTAFLREIVIHQALEAEDEEWVDICYRK
jgi:aminopeptidase 2